MKCSVGSDRYEANGNRTLIKSSIAAAGAAFMVLGTVGTARAAVLTFDYDGLINGNAVNQAYGDNITVFDDGVFSYGAAGGLTPDIVVDYSPLARTWTDDYGDLTNILYSFAGNFFELTLSATAGDAAVSLSGFEMAGWLSTDRVISLVEVVDGNDEVLFSQTDVQIFGATPGPTNQRRTVFDLENIVASELTIRFDPGFAGENVGIDNIQFSQIQISQEVPEPSTLLGTALIVGMGVSLRKRK